MLTNAGGTRPEPNARHEPAGGDNRECRRDHATGALAALLAAALLGAAPAIPGFPGAGTAAAAGPPRVASINLCADQLVLALADREQIVTVSWLAADPHESMLAAETAGIPLNYGTAEELLHFEPDVVIAGAFTGDFTRALLRRLGIRVLEMMPADTMADVERDIRLVADAVEQPSRGEAVIRAMHARLRTLAETRPAVPVDAVVVRPGGFTVGSGTLAHELMVLAGLRNVAAEHGLDRWGSLSMETLITAAPEQIILTGYRGHEPSLANAVLEHPALARMTSRARTVTVPAAYWACGLPDSLESVALMRAGLVGGPSGPAAVRIEDARAGTESHPMPPFPTRRFIAAPARRLAP